MTTIKSENFDSVTAPALPTGWSFDAANATIAAGYSSPNALRCTADGSARLAFTTANDGNGGDAVVEMLWKTTSASGNTSIGLLGRVTNTGSLAAYHLGYDTVSGTAKLFRWVGAAATQIGVSVGGGAAALNGWYRSRLSTVGTTITGYVQRISDGYWLNTSGTWQEAQTHFQQVTDANVAGVGVSGIRFSQGGGGTVVVDDFLLKNTLAGTQEIAADHANLFWSPYGWRKSGSDWAQSNSGGAYLKARIHSTGIVLKVDVSPLAGQDSGNYPSIEYRIDAAPATVAQLTAATTTIALGTGLADAEHDVYVRIVRAQQTIDRWTTPISVVRITGLTIDEEGVMAAPTLRSNRLLWLGDSTTEGVATLGASGLANADARVTWTPQVAAALDAEYGQRGFGATGYSKAGGGNVPAVTTYWNRYDNATAFSGEPDPDYVFCTHGTADGTGSMSEAAVQAGAETLLAALRAAYANAWVYVVVPPSGAYREALTAAVATAAHARTLLLDPANAETEALLAIVYTGGETDGSYDGVHIKSTYYPVLAGRILRATDQADVAAAATSILRPADGGVTILNQSGTFNLAASNAAAASAAAATQLATDQAVVAAAEDRIVTGEAILGTPGTVTLPAENKVLDDTSYGAGGTEYTGTVLAEQVAAAPTNTQTALTLQCYDAAGLPAAGVIIHVKCRAATGTGDSYSAAELTGTSGANGVVVINAPRGTGVSFKARRGDWGNWVEFSGVNAAELEMPSVLGQP
jgi:hypothetical protein